MEAWGKRKAKCTSSMARAAASGDRSTGMPKASSTSALPDLEVMARLPCLATGTPAAAHTSATVVEMLKVLSRSPPVPQTSRISRDWRNDSLRGTATER